MNEDGFASLRIAVDGGVARTAAGLAKRHADVAARRAPDATLTSIAPVLAFGAWLSQKGGWEAQLAPAPSSG